MEEISPLSDDVLDVGSALFPRIVFLIGCARSGTSILGEALAEHPDVVYLFEASRIWNELVPPKLDHRLVRSDASPEKARAIYRALDEARGGVLAESRGAAGSSARQAASFLLLEKNPKHVIRIPFLDAIFPQAKFLHIIRDGRDTAASLMFRNRGASWGHLEIPGWRDLLARYPEENHIRCAHQWRDAVLIARADSKALAPGRYREIRYEDIVKDARGAVPGILEFLELPPSESVDAFLPRIQDATARSYHAKRQVRHYVDNHSRRVGRYLENLTPAELRDIEAVCGDLLRELGCLPT